MTATVRVRVLWLWAVTVHTQRYSVPDSHMLVFSFEHIFHVRLDIRDSEGTRCVLMKHDLYKESASVLRWLRHGSSFALVIQQ